MKPLLVGGELLGKQDREEGGNPASDCYFKPLVTDPISSDGQRFVLLPHRRFIVVLSYTTGKRLGLMVLDEDEENDKRKNNNGSSSTTKRIQSKEEEEPTPQNDQSTARQRGTVYVHCAALAWAPPSLYSQPHSLSQLLRKESKTDSSNDPYHAGTTTRRMQYLYVGCSNGSVLEYPIADLVELRPSTNSNYYDMDEDHCLPGPVYYPRRCIRVVATDTAPRPVQALSFPKEDDKNHGQTNHNNQKSHCILGYAIVTETRMTMDEKSRTDNDDNDNKSKPNSPNLSLVRIQIPLSTISTSLSSKDGVATLQYLDLSQQETLQPAGKDSKDNESGHVRVLAELPQSSITKQQQGKKSKPHPSSRLFAQTIHLLSCYNKKYKTVEGDLMIVVARYQNIQFFHDDEEQPQQPPGDGQTRNSMYQLPQSQDPLTTIALAPNGCDLACGHQSGKIYILKDIVKLYRDRLMQHSSLLLSKPNSTEPSSIIRRKLHWHAHAVATLDFESNSVSSEPYLYSGGIESVLCGWQLARGVDRPSLTLPRIALGGIVHLCHVGGVGGGEERKEGDSTILVYCSNGSLQVFNTHNLKQRWMVSSIPFATKSEDQPSLQMKVIPALQSTATKTIALFGSPETAGLLHWFDPRDNEMQGTLDVAPFNRVSRTESKDVELPMPVVSHATWSASGRILMTVDVVATEIFSFGNEQTLSDGGVYGLITSLKFWSSVTSASSMGDNQEELKDKSQQRGAAYHVVAELSSPHGKNNRICAAAVSPGGYLACTVSFEEGVFRIWERVKQQSLVPDMAHWFCKYRVVIPSGFSNLSTDSRAVSFSADDSTLAIGFGNFVTLWDVDEQALLASLPHSNDDMDTIVRRISFLPADAPLRDMMLTSSERHVVLQSPFGHHGASNWGWCWSLPLEHDKVVISCAEYISSSEVVAVTLYDNEKTGGTLLLIGVVSGSLVKLSDGVVNLPGKVLEITSVKPPNKTISARENNPAPLTQDKALDIMFVVDGGRIYRWFSGASEDKPEQGGERAKKSVSIAIPFIPSLSDHIASSNPRKRTREAVSFLELRAFSETKLSVDHFGLVVGGETVVEDDVPLLRGAFGRSFLSRHLSREQ